MTLPGMPVSINDPGVFVCKIDDGAPREPVRKPAHAGDRLEQKRAPRHVWLVLALCPRCVAKTQRYCHEHKAGNWWLLTNWGQG